MSETNIALTIEGSVATARFHTQRGLNVLSAAVLDQIGEVAAQVGSAQGVRAFVLAATGKAFVAGADIKELADLDAAGGRALSARGNRAFDAIANLPCVTIARLHGAALGGGLEVALACDFRVALHDAKVGLPEASLGLIPGWKGLSRMAALAGRAATKRLAFSAAMIRAEEAHGLGIVDAVATDEKELDKTIADMIAAFRRGGPGAIAAIKRAMDAGNESDEFGECFAHEESAEGIRAFLDKRTAKWVDA